MVMHIYGKIDLLKSAQRPNVFLKEIDLYIDYLKTDIQNHLRYLTEKKKRSLHKFKAQLQEGLNYYKTLFEQLPWQATLNIGDLFLALEVAEGRLNTIVIAD
jgi:hypothetical protein